MSFQVLKKVKQLPGEPRVQRFMIRLRSHSLEGYQISFPPPADDPGMCVPLDTGSVAESVVPR